MITQPVTCGGLNYPSNYWKSNAVSHKAEHVWDRGILPWFLKRKPCLPKQWLQGGCHIQEPLFFPTLWVSPGRQLRTTQLPAPSPQRDGEENQKGESGKNCELR